MAKTMLCINCGYQGTPRWIYKGSVIIELILWLCFLLPGLIYSIWRSTSKYKACPECKASNMIPLNSPMAKKFLNSK